MRSFFEGVDGRELEAAGEGWGLRASFTLSFCEDWDFADLPFEDLVGFDIEDDAVELLAEALASALGLGLDDVEVEFEVVGVPEPDAGAGGFGTVFLTITLVTTGPEPGFFGPPLLNIDNMGTGWIRQGTRGQKTDERPKP